MIEFVLPVARLLAAFVLVVLNGFFVAAEFAFVRIRSTAVDQLVEEDRPGAHLLRDGLDNLDDYLAVTQLGITLASLGLGWLGEPAVATLIEPLIGSVAPPGFTHLIAFAIAFSFITFLHVVFGELAPKTIAIAEAERIALYVAAPMKFFYFVFRPGIIVFNGTANWFTRRIGIPPASETDETLTEEELRLVLSHSGTAGSIDAEEVEMIDRIFELDDIIAREVMVPRPDVLTATSDQTLEELREMILEADHTRYPVLAASDPEDVLGYIDVKDVMRAESEPDAATITAGDLARDLHVVPETAPIIDILDEMQATHRQMTVVIDEFGTFEGLVTIEDVIEHVVGDLRDQFDVGEPAMRKIGDGRYVIDGGVGIAEINDRLDTTLEVGTYTTIGGLVLDRLGEAPDPGDRVEIDGYAIEVTAVEGTRIERVEAAALEEN